MEGKIKPYPSVSVVVAVLNRKEEVARCIGALMGQAYPNYEVLVVDGGSKDGTWEFLQKEAKRMKKLAALQDLRPGRNPARNTGIARAKGKFILFVDSDCIPEKGWISEMLKPFKNGKVGGVIGTTIADRKGLFWYHMENRYLQFIGHNNAYRTELVRKLGGFDERFRTAKEDTDLSFRVMKAGWEVVYQPSAKMTHTSRRAPVTFRLRNQRHFVYDGLLRAKHPDLYGKYFRYTDYRNTAIATACLVVCTALLPVFPLLPAAVAVAYISAALSKLLKADGTLKEKAGFLLLAWLIPVARFYHFTRGFIKFRNARL
jgi:cellulose synthase/poly-beta-1,6-N-acetylglucosamine synthase-like glycosyltransferase